MNINLINLINLSMECIVITLWSFQYFFLIFPTSIPIGTISELVFFVQDNHGDGKMSVMDIQLSHAQVLLRSSFCRRVLAICFLLERVEGLVVSDTK